ncbi:thiolase family protein [Thalassovita sp.]|uniref:thiolase family protein n=1 Tax=Thalassovita sp. TaxID=1979401 RepID=UPI0029DE5420|nr:thiolase family protein [Thalassovita sp.]
MNAVHILAARRTAVVPRNGAFAGLALHEMAAPVITALLQDSGLQAGQVGEVIVSNALGAGGNPARSVALASGLPQVVAGLTLDRQCAGGLDAVLLAQIMVQSGMHDVVIAGGVESYSRRPLRLRTFADGRAPEPYDQAPFTPWPDRDPGMAEAADRLGHELGIPRVAQDEWAMDSHRKALECPAGILSVEIVGLLGQHRDGFARNLGPRHCARAPVVHGEITAANMAVAADAAAFVVVVSDRVARKSNGPMAQIIGGATLGGDPDLPGLAPVQAIGSVLSGAGIKPDDLAVAEVMEAFAVQAIACQQGAGLPARIVNPYGGALARGHPVGTSGAVLAVRLFHAMQRDPGYGLATIAAAGGLGTALLLRVG